ncbi:GlsB/YeaQ/YmgE family stress response membrane protein [Planobacterium oryzisoli]|uniref:GlsB/YeaQ/YmgE family stress response membrane protein n=1 Tax=Planobacterium oryzisoli TaxID=2771435 RepID=A0A931E404_9FLAO|nr:GlsB/YeaQ/YmgE family stress response membrane protein [Planobacterium oryzisoli]MBF5026180.1 GlsB/YeaQ/YmgE family stress response membrane protein [Planobacterium oryzisoli]
MGILWTLIIGAIAGWLGSQIFKGGSLGLIGNIVVGIVGGFIGYWLLGATFGTAIIGQILTGAVGAIVLLAIINLLTGRRV